MANEITINVSATLKNPSTGSSGFLSDQFAPGSSKFTQTTAGKSEQIVTTSTSDTAVTLTGITTPGWMMLLNLDSTNSVDWGPTSGGAIVDMGTLGPGESAGPFKCKSTVTLRLQATAGTPKVQVKVWEV
jgi:hypothetical protein